MKTVLTVLVAGSLALNLVCLALLISGRTEAPDTVRAPVASPASVAAAATTPLNDQVWAGLRAGEDLPAMVQRLRAAGFPPDVIRAIMAAQLRENFAARLKAIDPGAESRPFWKSTNVDPRVQQAQSQLYREQRKLLRELLGADADPQENVNAIFQGRRLDSVPAEKIDDVRRLLREHEEARADAFSNFSGGMLTAEMQKKLKAVDKNHLDALAAVLSPAEFEAYSLRNSDTSRQLRGNLTAFNPTEDEFRTLYKLQAAYDERFGQMYAIPSPEEQRQRSEAQRELNEQIKSSLGPARGAEYERATDYNYRQTSQLVARLELPADTTTKIWELKQDVEQRANALRRDTSLSPEVRTQQLAAIAAESTAKLTPLLGGERGMEAFKQYGGFWYSNLTQRPGLPTMGTTTTIISTPSR